MKNKTILFSTFLFLVISLIPRSAFSQLVAIIGYNGSTSDGYSFVAIEAITAGTVIYFTETEHTGGGVFNTGESVVSWTAPAAGVAKGVVTVITETSSNTTTSSCVSAPCGTTVTHATPFSLATTAETVYAYSDTDSDPTNGTTEIYSVFRSDGALPMSENPLIHSPNAIIIDGLSAVSHAQYTVALRTPGPTTKADLENPANYTQLSGNNPLSTNPFIDISLPVELISFTVKKMEEKVSLDWATASEIDNDYFNVERSSNGHTFEVVGKIEGNGTTILGANYAFMDENPMYGVNYYRLQQVDFNGVFAYSDIRSVKFENVGIELAISPNPTHKKTQITLPTNSNNTAKRTVEVFDALGKIAKSIQVSPGVVNVTLDLSNLQSGTYFVRTLSDSGMNFITLPVVKM